MRKPVAYSTVVILSAVLGPTLAADESSSTVEIVPNANNYRDWVTFIRPNEAELAFERVGWRGRFWPAVQEARRLGRPILLWTMNGHPLGCT